MTLPSSPPTLAHAPIPRPTSSDPAHEDRASGCLLGLAIGDALGATLEFQPRPKRATHRDIIGGGPFNIPPGAWTDDTATALCIADSLLAHGALNATDVMDRFVGWWLRGDNSATGVCFDIGATTLAALARFLDDRQPWAGSCAVNTAGNGSLVRLAPLIIFAGASCEAARHEACAQSLLTHAHPTCIQACNLFSQALWRALNGYPADLVFELNDWPTDTALNLISRDWRTTRRADIRSSGYVADSLHAALWAVQGTDHFEDALIRAVNLGGDADTIGAIAGQLAGALYGASSIPQRWLSTLRHRDRIIHTARHLLAASSRRSSYLRYQTARDAHMRPAPGPPAAEIRAL